MSNSPAGRVASSAAERFPGRSAVVQVTAGLGSGGTPSRTLASRFFGRSDGVPPGVVRALATIGGTRLAPQSDPRVLVRREFARPADQTELERTLASVVHRLRWHDTVRNLPSIAVVGAVSALFFATVARALTTIDLAWVFVGVSLLLAGIAVVRQSVRRIGPFEVARRLDHELHLKAQLATALELQDEPIDGDLGAMQQRNAQAIARSLIFASVVPILPSDTVWRKKATFRAATATVSIGAMIAVLVWPSDPPSIVDEPTLVLADARAPSEVANAPETGGSPPELQGEAVVARSERPSDVGAPATGALGARGDTPDVRNASSSDQATTAASGSPDASASGANASAQRGEALQKLGEALRQSQASRAAGESLRRGDNDRAAEQISQLADQLARLTPSEREALAAALDQGAKNTASGDRQVSDAAKQASQALGQFRNSDAREALKREATAVRQASDASAAQRDKDARAQDLAKGNQPSLATGDTAKVAPRTGAPMPNGAEDQGSQEPSGGAGGDARDGDDGNSGLGTLDQQLRAGGADGRGSAPGQGAGPGSGGGSEGAGRQSRLQAISVPVQVQADQGDGPSQWRPPRPDTPASIPPSPPPVPNGPVSAAPIGAGPDSNLVPREHAESVRQYFLPEPDTRGSGTGSGPPPTGSVGSTRGLVDGAPPPRAGGG